MVVVGEVFGDHNRHDDKSEREVFDYQELHPAVHQVGVLVERVVLDLLRDIASGHPLPEVLTQLPVEEDQNRPEEEAERAMNPCIDFFCELDPCQSPPCQVNPNVEDSEPLDCDAELVAEDHRIHPCIVRL